MPRYDFRTPRLFVDAPLAAGGEVALDRNQTNYLRNVLRLGQGDAVLLFNGRDGEWQASLASAQKRTLSAAIGTRLRAQSRPADLHFVFAPLKHARLDYMVQKAVEMGASLLQPVITRHTQVTRINLDRMRANVIEAAE
ncbi:MAG: RsmE family RNA methyltransferase, partial [Pseudolabrys sp.]